MKRSKFNCSHLIITISRQIVFSYLLYIILQPSPVEAGSKAASVTPLATNPASSVFLHKNSFIFSGSPISSNDVKLRYVGSETITKKAESPLSFGDIQTGFVLKPTRRISFGVGELLPPVTIGRKIEDIPVVILNDVSMVDLDIKASVKYGISLFGGYLVNERLSIGGAFASRQIDVKATANTSSGERLLNGHFRITTSSANIGLNYVAQPNHLRLGLATSVFSSNALVTGIDTPLVSGENANALNNKSASSNLVFGDFLFGAEFSPNSISEIYADVIWKRADKGQKEFSLVDLKEKPKDIYDTTSVFIGGKYRAQEKQYALLGFSYEPSAVGAGSPGENGKSGFGMRETALLYSGFGDLLPAWSVSIGLQYGNDLKTISDEPQHKHSDKSKTENSREKRSGDIWERSTFGISMRYRRASLGVDDKGELPAAYSQVRLQFPITIQTTF